MFWRGSLGIYKRKLKDGKTWYGVDKWVNNTRLKTPAQYDSPHEAKLMEAAAIREFKETGVVPEWLRPRKALRTSLKDSSESGETLDQLYKRWVGWLFHHRSERHATDMANLFGEAQRITREAKGLPAIEGFPLAKLDTHHIEAWGEAWASDLVRRGKGRGEVNKWLRHSQTAWNEPWGRRRAKPKRDYNPWQYVDRYATTKKAKYVPMESEVAALRMICPPEIRLFLEIMYETAARPSEARSLAWQAVRYQEAPFGIILETKKTMDGSTLPRRLVISDDLAARFKSWRRQQGPGKLFVFQQVKNKKPRQTTWLFKKFTGLCAKAEVTPFSPGCMRHFTASRWAHEGVPLIIIQQRLGHQRATTTDNYLRTLIDT
jgi:integrase